MRSAIILAALLIPLHGARACESHGFVSVSVDKKIDGHWIGEFPATFQAGYRFQVSDSFYVAPVLTHHSNWELGWPNGPVYEEETWANTYGVEFEGRFW